MSKYWKLYEEISRETQDGTLDWKEVDCLKHSRQIIESWAVTRQYEAPFSFGGQQAIVLCVEKRIFVDEDFLFPFEDRTCELLVIKDEVVLEKIAAPQLPWYWLRGFPDQIIKAGNCVVIPQQA